jgi:hypothetical protein
MGEIESGSDSYEQSQAKSGKRREWPKCDVSLTERQPNEAIAPAIALWKIRKNYRTEDYGLVALAALIASANAF